MTVALRGRPPLTPRRPVGAPPAARIYPPPLPKRPPAGSTYRRRRLVVVAVLIALAAAGVVLALLLLVGSASTTVPDFRGLPRAAVAARARRLGLQPSFSARYSNAATGLAIAQDPAAGARVAHRSTVEVTLSAGPAPVQVPNVIGTSAQTPRTPCRPRICATTSR